MSCLSISHASPCYYSWWSSLLLWASLHIHIQKGPPYVLFPLCLWVILRNWRVSDWYYAASCLKRHLCLRDLSCIAPVVTKTPRQAEWPQARGWWGLERTTASVLPRQARTWQTLPHVHTATFLQLCGWGCPAVSQSHPPPQPPVPHPQQVQAELRLKQAAFHLTKLPVLVFFIILITVNLLFNIF